MTSYKPEKLKRKQVAFKAKQEQILNQILKQHPVKHRLSKTNQTDNFDQNDRTDKGGFDEWYRKRSLRNNNNDLVNTQLNNDSLMNNFINNSNQTNQLNQTNQSIQQSIPPVPPIRKSKLLSAAIVNNKSSSQIKLIPNNSPVIATICSPNSKQTLQVRSHLVVHPSNGHRKLTVSSSNEQSLLNLSPIPFRSSTLINQPNHNGSYLQPQPFRFDRNGQQQMMTDQLIRNSNAINQTASSQQQKSQNSFFYPSQDHQFQNYSNHQQFNNYQSNQTFHGFEPTNSFSPINVPNHQSRSLIRNNQLFARKTLPPSFINRPSQYFTSQTNSQLPHSSTFIVSSPFDHHRHQLMNNLRLRSLSAPEKVNSGNQINRTMYLNDSVSYFSPIQPVSSVDHQSSFNYNPSSRETRHHQTLINGVDNRFNYFNQPTQLQTTPTTPNNFNLDRTHSNGGGLFREFASDSLIVGSNLHRIETINQMRLAQLAKEKQSKLKKTKHPIVDDYLRPIDYYAMNQLNSDQDFEADIEDESSTILFHKSFGKRLNGKIGSTNEELTTSSGRGSSNLDNSPKINLSTTLTNHRNEQQTTILKSNSSSSGFASRTFSLTGSPDKQSMQPSNQPQSIENLRSTKKLNNNETSEADENYEFDFESRLNALQRRSRSNCTTPLRFYDVDKETFLAHSNQRSNQLQNYLLKNRRQRTNHQHPSLKYIDHLRLINNTPTISDDYFMNDVDMAADEEIRHLVDKSTKNNDVHHQRYHQNRYRSSRNRSTSNDKEHHLNLMDKISTNLLLKNSTEKRSNHRTVFSDSELYDNHHFNSMIDASNCQRDYLMTRYWRRIRCEQLKQELNEFRMKFNIETNLSDTNTNSDLNFKNHQPSKSSLETTTDHRILKNETAC